MNKKAGAGKIGKPQDRAETEPDEMSAGFGISDYLRGTQYSARE